MNVLLLGDGHVYGRGLPVGQLSYVAWFIKLIGRTGRAVSVDAYAHLTLPQTLSTLAHLPLSRYDLIIVQPGHDWFEPSVATINQAEPTAHPAGHFPLPQLSQFVSPSEADVPSEQGNYLKNTIALLTARVAFVFGQPSRLRVTALLDNLRPYRHNVLLLTPLPHLDPVRQVIREQNRRMLLRAGNRQLFSVFDAHSAVQPREEYFLPGSDVYLNAVSHELLGRALFDFYQSAPTIVTVQAIKPD